MVGAKCLGRVCSVNLEMAGKVSPALLAALVILAQTGCVQGVELEKMALGATVYSIGSIGVMGQPIESGELAKQWLLWVVGILLVVVGVCVVWWCRINQASESPAVNQASESTAVNQASESPAVNQASESTAVNQASESTAVSQAPESESDAVNHTLEAFDEPADPIGASGSTGDPPQRRVDYESRDGVELCTFPMVGRVDWRSNWVPSHYLRWLCPLLAGHWYVAWESVRWKCGG